MPQSDTSCQKQTLVSANHECHTERDAFPVSWNVRFNTGTMISPTAR